MTKHNALYSVVFPVTGVRTKKEVIRQQDKVSQRRWIFADIRVAFQNQGAGKPENQGGVADGTELGMCIS